MDNGVVVILLGNVIRTLKIQWMVNVWLVIAIGVPRMYKTNLRLKESVF